MSIERLRDFFADPTVIEVLVNGTASLTVVSSVGRSVQDSIFQSQRRNGALATGFCFCTQGVRLDPRKPFSGGLLEEFNLRWHCLIPPVAIDGPILCSVRRHAFSTLTLQNFHDPACSATAVPDNW